MWLLGFWVGIVWLDSFIFASYESADIQIGQKEEEQVATIVAAWGFIAQQSNMGRDNNSNNNSSWS